MNQIVGSVKINSVSNSSNVQIGNVGFIVLSSSNKMNAGANSFAPGDSVGSVTSNPNSITTTNDPDVVDGASGGIV